MAKAATILNVRDELFTKNSEKTHKHTHTMPLKQKPVPSKQKAKHPISQDDKICLMFSSKEKNDLVNFKHFLGIAKQSQDYWLSDSCADLRKFCRHYEAHPQQFPMKYHDSPRVDGQNPAPEVEETRKAPALSTGFFDRLNASTAEDEKVEPVLQVLTFEIKYEKSKRKVDIEAYEKSKRKKGGKTTPIPTFRRCRLVLWDGGQKMVLGVLATNLNNDACHQLSEGQPIIRVKKFNIVQYREDNTYTQPGIFLLQYQYLCMPLTAPVKMSSLCFLTYEADTKTEEREEVIKPHASDDEPLTIFHRRIVDYQSNSNMEPLPSKCLALCKPSDRLCSRYGIVLNYCLAEHYEANIKSGDFIEAIACGCPLVDRDVIDMEPHHKRFLLYWWFATNIYFVKGNKNRQELPPCVEACIKMTYPNHKGTPYVGFKSR